MRETIASILVVLLLVCGWSTYVAATSHGGVSRMLEGIVFVGLPLAAAAGATSLIAAALGRRTRSLRLRVYVLVGVLPGALLGFANLAALSNDQSVGFSLVAEQLAFFGLLGAALGALVFWVSSAVRRCTADD